MVIVTVIVIVLAGVIAGVMNVVNGLARVLVECLFVARVGLGNGLVG